MTLDARALVTLIRRGPAFELIVAKLAEDENTRVCATALAEAAILLNAPPDPFAVLTVQQLVDELGLIVVPFTRGDWRAAAQQHELLRRQEGHATLGRCLSAAIAANMGAPLVKE